MSNARCFVRGDSSVLTILSKFKSWILTNPLGLPVVLVILWTLNHFLLFPLYAPSVLAKECDQACVEEILDFERYEVVEEFRAAIREHYVRGSDVTLLLKELQLRADWQKEEFLPRLPNAPIFIRFPIAWIFRLQAPFEKFEIHVQDSDYNRSIWSIGVMHDEDGSLVKLELLRFFEYQRFADRGLPFRFENFRTGEILTLRQMIDGKVTDEKIDRLMRSLGARFLRHESKGPNFYDLIYSYHVDLQYYLDPPTTSILRERGKSYIIWSLKSDPDTFRRVQFRGPAGVIILP